MKLILKKINYTQKNKYFNAKPNMKKQLARSKIDSKILNHLALFVRVFHPSFLFARKIAYFACKTAAILPS